MTTLAFCGCQMWPNSVAISCSARCNPQFCTA